jgi:chromosome segregation ATPase
MDQELIAYLEERFRENSRQIMEGVRSEVGTVREEIGTVRGEVGTVREEVGTIRGEVGTVHGEIGSLRQEMVSRFEQVDEALRENRDEIRHTQIVMESMRSDLQGVAEGVLSTNQRIDALREEMDQKVTEVRNILQLSHTDANKRVRSLEEWRKRVGEDPVPRFRKKSAKKS